MDLLQVTNPLEVLDQWMGRAKDDGVPTWNAFTLATVDPKGHPNARIVLVKAIVGRTLHFFTNYESDKSLELERVPFATLVYHHGEREVQAKVRGRVERLSRAESEAYFATRPRESQIGAWASHQSRVLPSREELLDRIEEVTRRFESASVTCPPHWGGFSVAAEEVELWFGKGGRLHERARYDFDGARYAVTLLNP